MDDPLYAKDQNGHASSYFFRYGLGPYYDAYVNIKGLWTWKDISGPSYYEISKTFTVFVNEGTINSYSSSGKLGSFEITGLSVPARSATKHFGDPETYIFNGDDQIVGSSKDDLLRGWGGSDTVSAGAGNDTIDGGDGQGYLRGDEGADKITGGAGFDDINGNMGADTASGGLGADWVVGGKDNDVLSGDQGDDIVYGNIGADWCDGGEGNDVVRGGQDNDTLLGQAGNDWLSGDKGDDTITGGSGADIFHSFGEAGIDRITDFSRAQGDRVMLDPGSSYTASQQGADTVVNLTGGAKVILVGVQLSSLGSDWIFVG